MLDIKYIREHPEEVQEALKKRDPNIDIGKVLELDEKRRALIKEVDDLRANQNEAADRIANLQRDERKSAIEESRQLKARLEELESEMKAAEEEFNALMYSLPNIPHPEVPVGKDESENKVLRTWGERPSFDFEPKDHIEIGEQLDLIDTQHAAIISGARFAYLKGPAVSLQFALVQLAFEVLSSPEKLQEIADTVEGGASNIPFRLMTIPLMIKPEVYTRAGRLSEATKDERYRLAQDDLYLIGSGEHTLIPLHMDEVIDEKNFPLRYVTFSTCFRREAGSYGKDTRGILRMHQFDKVEMVSFTTKENSFNEHLFFIAIEEYLVKLLKLPYQVVLSCTGDTDEPCAHHVDIEVWMPGQDKYRETHSADYTTDYQTRRLNARVRREDGKVELMHANDATVFAIGRMLIAILENYQQEDGSVKVPEVLQRYIGGKTEIKANI